MKTKTKIKSTKKKAVSSKKSSAERRKSVRREVLESFHVFLVFPEFGLRRVYLKDVSLGGVGFYAEPEDQFKEGQSLSFYFYINPSLRLPLKVRVAHVAEQGNMVKIGCEFSKSGKNAMEAYQDFIKLLGKLSEFLENKSST